jgi:hypothetical protein
VSNSRCNLDHSGTSSPASAFERLSASAGHPARNGGAQSRGVGNALSRLLLLPLYRLYEIRLRSQVCAQPAPRHVGIILDAIVDMLASVGPPIFIKFMRLVPGSSTMCWSGAVS